LRVSEQLILPTNQIGNPPPLSLIYGGMPLTEQFGATSLIVRDRFVVLVFRAPSEYVRGILTAPYDVNAAVVTRVSILLFPEPVSDPVIPVGSAPTDILATFSENETRYEFVVPILTVPRFVGDVSDGGVVSGSVVKFNVVGADAGLIPCAFTLTRTVRLPVPIVGTDTKYVTPPLVEYSRSAIPLGVIAP
jgi:hypothetical protein